MTDKLLFKNAPYDAEKDFVPVAMIYETGTFTMAVRSDLPIRNLPELIAYANKRPSAIFAPHAPIVRYTNRASTVE